LATSFTDILRKGREKSILQKTLSDLCGEWTETETLVFGPAGSFPFLRMKMLRDVRRATGDYYDESFVTGWRTPIYGFVCSSGDGDAYSFQSLRLARWLRFYRRNATFFSKSLDYRTRILRNRLYLLRRIFHLRFSSGLRRI